MRKIIISLPMLAAACSTIIEDQASENYAPVYPAQQSAQYNYLPDGSIYNDRASGLFAMDRRAAQVGDILTVSLNERFAASKNQSANANKTDDFNLLTPSRFGPIAPLDVNAGSSRSFSGNGSATQSNSLTGKMSVTVVRVLPGGNLEIMGQKKLTLNNGDEYVRLRGVVRPADISADNIVDSNRIAHAEIKYIGAGQIADAGKQGWLSEAVSTVSPF